MLNIYNVYIVYIHYKEIAMDIIISNSSREPIYEQIVMQIKSLIMSGELQPGDALPSMRSLAGSLRISVITTKRAYEELEREGFIESYTGKGSFVKQQNMEFIKEENLRRIENLLSQAADKAKMSDISLEELNKILKIMYEENGDE